MPCILLNFSWFNLQICEHKLQSIATIPIHENASLKFAVSKKIPSSALAVSPTRANLLTSG